MKLITARLRSWTAASVVVAFVAAASSPGFAQRQRPPANFSVLPITITGVIVQNGQLFATGRVGSNPFPAPVPLGVTAQQQPGAACPILNLQVGEIDLNLLGLIVETSEICLDITAMEGGGLLGDLLCEVANLLQSGTSLADILALLQSRNDLTTFLGGLTDLLNEVFDRLTSNRALAGATCQVLSLALGPIELNLLGLVVELDDCDGGPVTLDITADPAGGLLGDLLCSLADLLGNRASPLAINAVLFQIARLLGQLLG